MGASGSEDTGRFAFLEEVEVKRVGSVEQVAQALRAMIADGRLSQGDRLPEIPMARALRVSRNTLRDAVRQLGNEGLVRHELHRGAIVRRLSCEDVADIYAVRRRLELPALALVAAGDERAHARASAALARCEQGLARDDYTAFVEAELEFHAALVSHLGSARFDHFFAQVLGELRLLYSELSSDSDPATSAAILATYRELYAAAERGEVERAQQLMGAHLDSYEARLHAIVGTSAAAPAHAR
jgi:DNA-binding GntR family transcriptional regulator